MQMTGAVRQTLRGTTAIALIVGNLFLHKPISDVCDALFARIGRVSYEWVTLIAIGALSLAGAALLLRGGAPALRSGRAVAALIAAAAAAVAAQHWLLVTNVELIHLPQFGLLAVLLLATGLPPPFAWLGAVIGGVIDETYQFMVIYAALPNPSLDWNDVVLNAIGAAGAVLLASAGRPRRSHPRRTVRAVGAALLLAALLAVLVAPPQLVPIESFPYYRPALGRAATGRIYRVMVASEGLAALLALWCVVNFGTAPRRVADNR